MPAISHDIDRLAVSSTTTTWSPTRTAADEDLAGRLGLETATDQMCWVGLRPGRKLPTLVSSLVAGGTYIDDIDALRTIDDDAWVDIDDYIGARAQVAETSTTAVV